VRSDRDRAQMSTYRFPEELRFDELLVRPPSLEDVDLIAPAFSDPAVGGEASLPPFGPDLLRVLLTEQLPAMRERGLLSPYVIEDAGAARVLGGAALHHFDPLRDAVELGYWLFVDARGRGVATRTVRALADDAFAQGIVRVEAHVRVGNGPSERVLERLGFEREGVRRRFLRHDGVRVDATLYALLAGDA
jgi:RimJ/RimL family protein N-acetyltransferase